MMELWQLPTEFRHWFWPPGISSIFHRNNNNNHESLPIDAKFSHPFGLTGLQSDLVGIFLTIIGAVFASLGSIWEAYEDTRQGPLSNVVANGGGYIQMNAHLGTTSTNKCSELFDLKFLLGILIWLFGAGLHVLGLLFAAASLLGPVNSAGLVSTLWLSYALLNDELTWETWISSAGIVTGIGICLRASVATTKTYGADLTQTQMELLTSWTDPVYLSFCAILIIFITLAAFGIHRLNKIRSALEWRLFLIKPQYDLTKRRILGERFQATEAARELDEISRTIQKHSDVVGILLAIMGGACGSQTVCQIKEIEAYWTMTEFEGYGYLLSPSAVWALIVLIVCATVQYPLISSAYSLADHATVSALYHVSWTLLSVIGGFAKFKEHRGSTSLEIMWFSLGLSLTLISTVIAAKRTVEGIISVMGDDLLNNEWYMSNFSIAPIWKKLWPAGPLIGALEQNGNAGGQSTNAFKRQGVEEELEMQGLESTVKKAVQKRIVDDYGRDERSCLPSPTPGGGRSRSFDHTFVEDSEF